MLALDAAMIPSPPPSAHRWRPTGEILSTRSPNPRAAPQRQGEVREAGAVVAPVLRPGPGEASAEVGSAVRAVSGAMGPVEQAPEDRVGPVDLAEVLPEASVGRVALVEAEPGAVPAPVESQVEVERLELPAALERPEAAAQAEVRTREALTRLLRRRTPAPTAVVLEERAAVVAAAPEAAQGAAVPEAAQGAAVPVRATPGPVPMPRQTPLPILVVRVTPPATPRRQRTPDHRRTAASHRPMLFPIRRAPTPAAANAPGATARAVTARAAT